MYPHNAMRKPSIFLAVSCLLAVPGLSIAAQNQQVAATKPADDQPMTTLKVQAREVLLPVTVRDKHGAMVTTLRRRTLR